MPAKLTKSSSSQSDSAKKSTGKQSTLLGFFNKPPATPQRSNGVIEPKETPTPTPAATGGEKAAGRSLPVPITPVATSLDVPTTTTAENEPPSSSFPPPSSPTRGGRKKVNYAESDDEDDDEVIGAKKKPAAKRRKTVVDDDDEDGDFNMEDVNIPEDFDDDLDEFMEDATPQKPKAKMAATPASKVPSLSRFNSTPGNSTPSARTPKASTPASTASKRTFATPASAKLDRQKSFKEKNEERYSWLSDPRDAEGRRPTDSEYDPRTLFVPKSAWSRFSPFETQFWEIKSKLMDTVVFFKKGKFYELYENDATIGHQEFDLKLTDRVNMRMVGVPEKSFEYWAAQFIAKGYKVAKVDQMETALGKEIRDKDSGKKEDKIIRRELTMVLTAGTLVDPMMLTTEASTYCMAIKEHCDLDNQQPTFGVVFVDTANAEFQIAAFEDDLDRTKLETLIAQVRPRELLLEKSYTTPRTMRVLKNAVSCACIWNYIKSEREFWDAETTQQEIMLGDYFPSEDGTDAGAVKAWPEPLRQISDDVVAMSAFGALLWYLKQLKLDKEVVSLGNFHIYDPVRKATSLVLDGQTLANLEIFANTFDGGADGTLFKFLNRCVTPFGKRLLRQWVCHPLFAAESINARLDAVDLLNGDMDLRDGLADKLRGLPDLERLISRIHAGKCKVQDFVKVLESFQVVADVVAELRGVEGIRESVIGELVGAMPDIQPMLRTWETAFDHVKAKEDGLLIPEPGVEEDFDESQRTILGLRSELDKHLEKIKKELGSSKICYKDLGKEIFQVEVPVSIKVPSNWALLSSTKAVKRWWPPAVKESVKHLLEAEERHKVIVEGMTGRLYARFDEHYAEWLGCIKRIAQLDCLCSLARSSLALGEPSCRPEFVEVEGGDRGVVEFEELRHPCVVTGIASSFIANDTKLGGDESNLIMITGPNMSGKSTLLRQTCIGVILAQIGCYVPAAKARLTTVDRIMSRLGANDNIFAAQSTFMVELAETKKILSEATPRSLVILDELGRGTSSYDGMAIAYAVLEHLATHVGCMGFFATHYQKLAADFENHPEVTFKNMSAIVDDEARSVVFLYKLVDGICPKSYGFHCASGAGVPSEIVDRAEEAAERFEEEARAKAIDAGKSEEKAVSLAMQSEFAWLCNLRKEDVNHSTLRELKAVLASCIV
ncbi:DNA mismatch repair protein msh6 [Saitoella coloradoensis]